MSLDNIVPQKNEEVSNVSALNLMVVQSDGTVTPTAQQQQGVTGAEAILMAAMQHTKDVGNIPDDTSMKLFQAAMHKAEGQLGQSSAFLKRHDKDAHEYVDGQLKVISSLEGMTPDQFKTAQDDMTAYMQNLAPHAKLEKSLAQTYGNDFAQGLHQIYDVLHRADGKAIADLYLNNQRLMDNDQIATDMYDMAKQSRYTQTPLQEVIMKRALGEGLVGALMKQQGK